jgi:probable phosphoglycerate mutase
LQVISNRGLVHPLTELGRQQAAQLAQSLAGTSFARIYTSPVLRAIETAQIVSAELGVPGEVTDALREFDCGVVEGRSDEAAWAQWRWVVDEWLTYQRYDSRIEGGESFNDLRARFAPFIDRLVDAHRASSANFVLIGHGGLFFSMLPLVVDNIDAAFVREHPIPNAQAIVVQPHANGLLCVEWCGLKT